MSGESAAAEAVARQRGGGTRDLPGRPRAASAPAAPAAQAMPATAADDAECVAPGEALAGDSGRAHDSRRADAPEPGDRTPAGAGGLVDRPGSAQGRGAAQEPGLDADAGAHIEPTTGVTEASLRLPGPPPAASAVPAILPPLARPTAHPQPGPVPAPAAAPDDHLPFWLPVEEVMQDSDTGARAQRMPAGEIRYLPGGPPEVAPRPRKPAKSPRGPATGLASLVLLSLLTSFFAWVTAEPLWLAVGHGDVGTATVTHCTGGGVSQRCRGEFTAAKGSFTAADVPLAGVDTSERGEGTRVAAVMVGANGRAAYVSGGWAALHLRWALGMLGILLCGVGIVWGTGALRLADVRSRRWGALAGLAAPLLVAIGFLAATY